MALSGIDPVGLPLGVFWGDVFGGRHVISAGKWSGCCLSRITIPQVKACAVSLESTRTAMGVDKASLLAADLSVPKAWGLAVQQHPAGFEALKYSSRFIDQPCLALFDRGGIASDILTWAGIRMSPLGD